MAEQSITIFDYGKSNFSCAVLLHLLNECCRVRCTKDYFSSFNIYTMLYLVFQKSILCNIQPTYVYICRNFLRSHSSMIKNVPKKIYF